MTVNKYHPKRLSAKRERLANETDQRIASVIAAFKGNAGREDTGLSTPYGRNDTGKGGQRPG